MEWSRYDGVYSIPSFCFPPKLVYNPTAYIFKYQIDHLWLMQFAICKHINQSAVAIPILWVVINAIEFEFVGFLR